MKKVLFALVMVVAFAVNSVALQLEAGVNLADLSDGIDPGIGFRAGIVESYQVNPKFRIDGFLGASVLNSGKESTEVYSYYGTNYEVKSEAELNRVYVEIEARGNYKLTQHISIFAGPYMGLLASQKAKQTISVGIESQSEERDDLCETLAMGISLGGSIDIGALSIILNQQIGILEIAEDVTGTTTTIAVKASL